MYLFACQGASLERDGESQSDPSLSALCPLDLLSARYRMYLMRIVRSACATLSFPGRLFLICLLLDTFYLACLYDTAPLPFHGTDNASQFVNSSSEMSASASRSSSLSLPSQIAAPPAAALLPSSLSSSRLVYDEKHRGNVSFNETDNLNLESGDNASSDTQNPHSKRGQGHNNNNNNKKAVSSPRTGKARKEFPLALVVASATAAVSILVFFCLSYLWHTRQLDRRAQKLAIRLAAEAEDIKCSQCRSVPPTFRPSSSQDSGSDSGGEDSRVLPVPNTVLDELNSFNEEEEDDDVAEDGSRRKPGGVGRTLGSRRGSRGKGARRSGSRSSRKWSGHSSGQARSSLVTDQEILNHFASRRHSTFFI